MSGELPQPGGDELSDHQLVLGDLLNHVLDKGVVVSGQVTISIADIDLLTLDLRLLLTSVQTVLERQLPQDGNVPVPAPLARSR